MNDVFSTLFSVELLRKGEELMKFYMDILHRAKEAAEDAVALRRVLHACPEVDFDLDETLVAVTSRLTERGVPWRKVGKAGVVAHIDGTLPGRAVLLRADMDALPITEETDVPWRSKIEGCMHACGHDIHTACLLGSADVLMTLKDSFQGTVLLVFQPAEETSGGALPMIQGGLFGDTVPAAAFALHCTPSLPSGTVGVFHGPFCAASDMFDCIVQGAGAHGAEPQKGIDVVALSCRIVTALHHLVSRTVDPVEPAVLSVGSFHAGTARNILPERAEFSGILRTLDEKTRRNLKAGIRCTVTGMAEIAGAVGEVRFTEGYPVLRNDEELSSLVLETASKMVGKDRVVPLKKPQLTADDFAYFLQEMPGSYCMLGTGYGDGRENPPLHNPRFEPDESCIPVGIAMFAAVGLAFLERAHQK